MGTYDGLNTGVAPLISKCMLNVVLDQTNVGGI